MLCHSKKSALVWFAFTLNLLISLPAVAYTGWTSPHEISSSTITWGWAISDGASTPGVVNCGAPYCAFGPYIRTGLGPSGEYCDSGGVCFVENEKVNGITSRKVRAGITYDEAFRLYAEKWGFSGTNYYVVRDLSSPHIAWGKLCTGFSVLPWAKQAISQIVPGSSCAVITPPNTSCETSLPATIDLGTVSTGYIEVEATVDGITQCTGDNTVSVSLAVAPYLGGVPVELFINGKQLSSATTAVGNGKYVPLKLRASLRGTIREAGVYSGNAVMNISYF